MGPGCKIVLVCRPGAESRLDPFVARCVSAGVTFIAVAGERCGHIEDLIDELVVGDGSDEGRFILTSSHEGESLDEVIAFARSLTGEYAGEVQVIEL